MGNLLKDLGLKLQSAITNTVHRLQKQTVIDAASARSAEAAKAEAEVTDAVNRLLQLNAGNLKAAVAGAAKESQRGIADFDTLKMTDEALQSTQEEVVSVCREGRRARYQAETELQTMEDNLRKKLLELSRR